MKNFYVWFLICMARLGLRAASAVKDGAGFLLDAAAGCARRAEGCLPSVKKAEDFRKGARTVEELMALPGSSVEEMVEAKMASLPRLMTCDGGPFDGHVLPFGGMVVILHDTGTGQVCAYERSAVDRYRFLRVVGRKGALHE
jgi:hypothetical protein